MGTIPGGWKPVAVVKPRGIVRSILTSHTETILVTEPDQVIRQLVCRVLVPEGYRIVQTCSAEDAVRTAARHEIEVDLLLTEARLPCLFGWELADLLKLDYPKLKVIYMSGFVDAAIRARARRSRVVVLQNPFRGDRLRQAVHEVLDRQKNTGGIKFAAYSFLSLLRRCWQTMHLVDNALLARLKRKFWGTPG